MNHWCKYSKFNLPVVRAFGEISPTKFVIVDGGAAGKISQPFDIALKVAQSIRFEPRGPEHISSAENEIIINGGLWSEDCIKNLHIGVDPSTSSICRPNLDFLQQFDDAYGVPPRTTEKIIEVPLRSIDSCVKNAEMPLPNFIKLDVHSAELPALYGAINSLSNCVGLLVETWNSEVHKQQGLHYEVEKFAIENGFEVYDSICAARWHFKHKEKVCYAERGKYIGTEILFIRSHVSDDLLYHKAFVLSLFGFYNAALNLLSDVKSTKSQFLYNAIVLSQAAVSRSLNARAKRTIEKLRKFI